MMIRRRVSPWERSRYLNSTLLVALSLCSSFSNPLLPSAQALPSVQIWEACALWPKTTRSRSLLFSRRSRCERCPPPQRMSSPLQWTPCEPVETIRTKESTVNKCNQTHNNRGGIRTSDRSNLLPVSAMTMWGETPLALLSSVTHDWKSKQGQGKEARRDLQPGGARLTFARLKESWFVISYTTTAAFAPR